jgi:uncharacterized protein (DUF1330 family)
MAISDFNRTLNIMEKTNLSTTEPSNQKPSGDNHQETTEKTLLHRIYSRIYEQLLPPVSVTVSSNIEVMTYPPAADMLLRRENASWTVEQLERLPDGIRDSTARHILIEFKATESISKKTFIQAAAYQHFYQNAQKLTDDKVQTFVISAIQPQKANREQYGYQIRVQPGVYQSDNIAFNHITLISLNELPDELHNAWTTCLASKKRKRLKAFQILHAQGFQLISNDFKWFLSDLWQHISTIGDDEMALRNLTVQEIEEYGKMWGDVLLPTIPVEQRLAGVNPTDVMNYFKPEQLLAGLKPKERLAGLSRSEIEELEAQIKKLKQQKNG